MNEQKDESKYHSSSTIELASGPKRGILYRCSVSATRHNKTIISNHARDEILFKKKDA